MTFAFIQYSGTRRNSIGAKWSPNRFIPRIVLVTPLNRDISHRTWSKMAMSTPGARKFWNLRSESVAKSAK